MCDLSFKDREWFCFNDLYPKLKFTMFDLQLITNRKRL